MRGRTLSLSFPPFTKAVKWLVLANAAVYLFLELLKLVSPDLGGRLTLVLALIPAYVMHGWIFQVVTYSFVHAGILHILFNMLGLWMFGTEFERLWGTKRFLRFYFFCAAGAGLCVIVGNYLFGNPEVATIGSSGAIYGILLASAVMWPSVADTARQFTVYTPFGRLAASLSMFGVFDCGLWPR
jgi:membrane associated rhomboid family serine protease